MGHACYESGQIKATFGTGVFALANAGETIQSDHESGILSTVAWQFDGKKPVYAVEAGVYNAGTAVNWLRSLGLFQQFTEIERFDDAIERSRKWR